jgi:hypothetical protein
VVYRLKYFTAKPQWHRHGSSMAGRESLPRAIKAKGAGMDEWEMLPTSTPTIPRQSQALSLSASFIVLLADLRAVIGFYVTM